MKKCRTKEELEKDLELAKKDILNGKGLWVVAKKYNFSNSNSSYKKLSQFAEEHGLKQSYRSKEELEKTLELAKKDLLNGEGFRVVTKKYNFSNSNSSYKKLSQLAEERGLKQTYRSKEELEKDLELAKKDILNGESLWAVVKKYSFACNTTYGELSHFAEEHGLKQSHRSKEELEKDLELAKKDLLNGECLRAVAKKYNFACDSSYKKLSQFAKEHKQAELRDKTKSEELEHIFKSLEERLIANEFGVTTILEMLYDLTDKFENQQEEVITSTTMTEAEKNFALYGMKLERDF